MKNKLPYAALILYLLLITNNTDAQSTDTLKVKKGPNATPPKEVSKREQEQPGVVYSTFDEPPTPPGGIEGYKNYLIKNIIYPESAIKAKASGTVYVSLIVNKDG